MQINQYLFGQNLKCPSVTHVVDSLQRSLESLEIPANTSLGGVSIRVRNSVIPQLKTRDLSDNFLLLFHKPLVCLLENPEPTILLELGFQTDRQTLRFQICSSKITRACFITIAPALCNSVLSAACAERMNRMRPSRPGR